jgi:peptidoglycan/xylan/chitin deacetylase (PgdA/CDA1 family)
MQLRPPRTHASKRSRIGIAALGVAGLAGIIGICSRLDAGVPADAARVTNRPGVMYWHGSSHEPAVALTFDDGPSASTAALLDVLAEDDVHATFFMVGRNVETHPDLARRVVAAGHVVGNHSYSHPNLDLQLEARVGDELDRTSDAIFKATGVRSRLFRPPFGDEDGLVLHEARALGYVSVEWSVSSKDWTRPGADRIVANVLAHVHDGAIILMHDGGGDRSETIEAVARLIPELRRRGYALITVPELLGVSATFSGPRVSQGARRLTAPRSPTPDHW